MRIVATEMLFGDGQVRRPAGLEPIEVADIAFAWMQTEEPVEEIEYGRLKAVDERSADLALDYILRRQTLPRSLFTLDPQGHGIFIPTPGRTNILNRPIVAYLRDQPIVIEQSPPEWAALKTLLGSGLQTGSTAALAIFVVVSADPMMFVKLPAAYLIISGTKTLAKWVDKNGPKLLDKISKGKRK